MAYKNAMPNQVAHDGGSLFNYPTFCLFLYNENKIEAVMQTTITASEINTCVLVVNHLSNHFAPSILTPIKIKITAMPCCKYSKRLTAPRNKKNKLLKPSTAKIFEV